MPEIKRKIIYLEDDEFTRLMVQSQLENFGFSVESYSTFTDVRSAVKEKKFDLMITDLNIDNLHPEDIIKNIKALTNIPVVILSGSEEALEGADLHVSKPLTVEKITKIAELLQQRSEGINLNKVYQFACGDEELLIKYVSTFIDNFKNDLKILGMEVEKGNLIEVRNRVHKMLSSVAYYNHQPLNTLLQKVERNSSNSFEANLEEWFAQVKRHSDELIRVIQEKVLTGSGKKYTD